MRSMSPVRRQLRDYAAAALVAIAIATAAFVGVRNRELVARQLDLARRSVAALVAGGEPLPTVRGAVVGPATPSPKHPYLRKRTVDGRELGGAHGRPDDKLFYDAANRLDREGAFDKMLRDGS